MEGGRVEGGRAREREGGGKDGGRGGEGGRQAGRYGKEAGSKADIEIERERDEGERKLFEFEIIK